MYMYFPVCCLQVGSSNSMNGVMSSAAPPAIKEEPAVQSAPAQTRLTDTAQHLTSAAGVLADSPQPESIFSTDTTLLSNSGLSSTAAHTNSLMLRFPTTGGSGGNSANLALPLHTAVTTDISDIYKTLSPTSQPIDLSTKPLNIQGLSQHTTTTDTLPGHASSVQAPPPLYRQQPVTVLPTGYGTHRLHHGDNVDDDDDVYDA